MNQEQRDSGTAVGVIERQIIQVDTHERNGCSVFQSKWSFLRENVARAPAPM
jgi:hypothetical protein